jgi:hypothetical protein
MRFLFSLVCILLLTTDALPLLGNPVYVHARANKAKKHKAPKHQPVRR